MVKHILLNIQGVLVKKEKSLQLARETEKGATLLFKNKNNTFVLEINVHNEQVYS